MNQVQLSLHILPNASTMLGVCLTGIGLVKVAEAHLGPSHVDEYLALNAVFFDQLHVLLFQNPERQSRRQHAQQIGAIADIFFMIGLIAMTLISVLFAYEFV